jgi:hypothetical protein
MTIDYGYMEVKGYVWFSDPLPCTLPLVVRTKVGSALDMGQNRR